MRDRAPPAGVELLDPAVSNVSCGRPCHGRPFPPAQDPPVTANSTPEHTPGTDDEAQPLSATAAEWVVRRMGSDWSPADEEELRRWRRADAAHEAAFARAGRLWEELGALNTSPDLVATLAAPAAPTRAQPLAGTRRRPSGNGWWRHALAGGGLAVMAVVAVFSATGGQPLLAVQAHHRTAVGEARDVPLPDGSTAQLAADSAIAVQYSGVERRVTLLQGEAVFDAKSVSADGERRPFVVEASNGATRALGTRFAVERLATHTRVVGLEHRVAVSVAAAPAAVATLGPGQSVRYDATGVSAVEDLPPHAADAESNGQLVFDRTRLDDAVARLNRYHATHISVRGEALAARRVSGVFPATDPEGAIAALQSELKLRVLRLPGLVVLY